MSLNSERDGQAESGIVDCYVYNQRFTHCYREFAHCPPPSPGLAIFNFFWFHVVTYSQGVCAAFDAQYVKRRVRSQGCCDVLRLDVEYC